MSETGTAGSASQPPDPARLVHALGQPVIATDLTARRRVEDALAEAHRRFAGIVAQIEDVLVLLDAELTPRYLSPSLSRVLGYPGSDPAQVDFFGLVHPDDRTGLQGLLTDCRRNNGHREPCEVRLRHVDGDWRIVEATAANLLDDPSVGCILLTCHDVTVQRATQVRNRQLAALVEGAGYPIYATDLHGQLTDWNAAAERLFGYPAAEALGQPVSLIIPPELRDRAAGVLARVASGRDVDVYATEAICRDGRRLALSVRVSPIRDSCGRVVGTSRIARDVTAQRAAEAAVRASEERLRAVLANSPLVVFATDSHGMLTFVEGKVLADLGRTPEQLIGVALESFEATVPTVVRAARRSLDGVPAEAVMTIAERHYDVRLVPSRGSDGCVSGVLGVATDITERHQATAALRTSEAHYRAIVETAQEAICLLDATGTILVANTRLAELVGRALPELVGTAGYHLIDGLDEAVAAASTQRHRTRRRELYELAHTPPDGGPMDLVVAASPLYAPSEEFAGTLVMITDVTQRKRAEAELARLALHDSLTGLPNRALLTDRITSALGRRTRHSGQLGILFLDLDQFKAINDSLGHAAGDGVLTAVADRLRDAVRDQDTVGRLGGDEFIVLAEDLTGAPAAAALADRLLDALSAPIQVAGIDIVVSASIGIALCSAREPTTTRQLLHRADVAMHRAKSQGRACWATDDQRRGGPVVGQLQLLGELRTALASGELRLYYQPQVRLRSNDVVGVEALLRWQHPERGLLLPGEFLDAAEGSGLIRDIGIWVLEVACRQAADWHAAAPDAAPLTMSVNLSARQLDDPALATKVAGILADTGLDPASLVLEMTETALMSDADAALSTLTRLKALGVRLAVDDFGTGYSSMVYLKRFPVDELKIDRSFVAGLGEDPDDSAIVACVVQLAAAVGIRAVAEGVETERQRSALEAMGCELGQGYLWGPPKPADQFAAVTVRTAVRSG